MIRKVILKDREDWLKHRRKYIGGSDISAVVGCNPYKTNVDLWMEKTGRTQPEDISEKDYVKYGTQAEDLLRELFKLDFPEYEVFYEENNSFLNDKYPWAAASLDGWLRDKDGRLGIWECKTTNILQSMQKEKWNGRVPDSYYCQILMYMAVTGAEFCILKAQLKSVIGGIPYLQTKHYFFERRDVQEDIDYIMSEGEKFYRYIEKDEKPPATLPVF